VPLKVRTYICQECKQPKATEPGARGKLPTMCPDCKIRIRTPPSVLEQVELRPMGLIRTPFNSAPDRAPLPEPDPAAPPVDVGPGLLTRSITAELATMRSTSPMAQTLKASAILVAQAADAVPVEDLKQKMLAIKELRSIIEQLTKTAGGEDDDDADGPFGSSAPAVVHQATA